jgi:hypothetical protein
MGKITQKILVAIIFCFNSVAYSAECDTSTIKKTDKGTYEYTKDCHVAVGQRLEELDLRKEQVQKLNESVSYYKVGYDIQAQRADDWMKTGLQLDKELQRQKTFSNFEKVLYFGLGALFMYGAAQATR